MSVKQLSVFIENKAGKLRKAVNAMSQAGVNIRALSIADSSKYGILRLIVSDNETAIEALKAEKFTVKENDVIVVGIKDEPNGLNSTLEILEKAEINVEYVYAFVSTKVDEAIVVFKIENYEDGLKALNEANANILYEDDLAKI
ncbi:MAG: acetolactate synthase [Methanobrevibacter sp.]|nr:acetolactate synthase [Methanobrevibacter sp.]